MSISTADYVAELSKCPLFEGIAADNIIALTELLGTHTKLCGHNEIIIRQDEITNKFGIVLEGSVTAVRYNASGNALAMAKHGVSSIFGEILACQSRQPSPVNVIAEKSCVIMFINYDAIFNEKILKSDYGISMIKNLTTLMSLQYFRLEKKLRYISIPSIRERIIEYLSDCCFDSGNKEYTFSVPFDREGMAQYLNINRSALSRELSRMKKENIIDFNKNQFKLLKQH